MVTQRRVFPLLLLAAALLPISLHANELTNSTTTEVEVIGEGSGMGGSGGRDLLGTEAGLKDMFDGGVAASFRHYIRNDSVQAWTTLSVEWPYVYTNRRVTGNAGKYGYQYAAGKVAIYDMRSGTPIGNSYNNNRSGNYYVKSVAANGITIAANGAGPYSQSTLYVIFSARGGYKTGSQSCVQNMILQCSGEHTFLLHWVK